MSAVEKSPEQLRKEFLLRYYLYDSRGVFHRPNTFDINTIKLALETFKTNKEKAQYHDFGSIFKYTGIENHKVFVDLATSDAVKEVCDKSLGVNGYRLEHIYFVVQPTDRNYVNSVHGGQHNDFNMMFYHSYPQPGLDKVCYTRTGQLTVGIPLTGQLTGTGGFAYIPGSHKSSYHITGDSLTHNFLKHTPDIFDESLIVPELSPGDLICFPESLIHGQARSRVTLTGEDRVTLYCNYFPISIVFNRDESQRQRLASVATPQQKLMIYPSVLSEFTNLHKLKTIFK